MLKRASPDEILTIRPPSLHQRQQLLRQEIDALEMDVVRSDNVNGNQLRWFPIKWFVQGRSGVVHVIEAIAPGLLKRAWRTSSMKPSNWLMLPASS